MKKIKVFELNELVDRRPNYKLISGVDLVIIRYDDQVSVMYGRCLHRGALMSDGHIDGNNLICGVHGWDYRLDTGISEYNNKEALKKFNSWIDNGVVFLDADEVSEWAKNHPQPFNREEYLGLYQDAHITEEEPENHLIQHLAKHGLKKSGPHGPTGAMGVEKSKLPHWNEIQITTAQLKRFPLLDNEPVKSNVVIGPKARKPLHLKIPLFVSDMSFGALSEEAKIALAKGAELAGTGICSGEGGMLPEEQACNSRYFYELASGRFGYDIKKVKLCQAFHFKGGQGAKTGTGGHLPGSKVSKKIASVRGLQEGQAAISPSRFSDWESLDDIKKFADKVRQATGGIPIGYKLSAQRVEEDIAAALYIGVDYVILDGRGGGTGAAPLIFRDHISVPTIPALARARRYLDAQKASHVSLIITGGLRVAPDFVKALALGADAIALSNSALQAIGCLGMRACHTNNCPVGIATQKKDLRRRLVIDESAKRLHRFFSASTELMQVMARACGHNHLSKFNLEDLVTLNPSMSKLSGVHFAGDSIF